MTSASSLRRLLLSKEGSRFSAVSLQTRHSVTKSRQILLLARFVFYRLADRIGYLIESHRCRVKCQDSCEQR